MTSRNLLVFSALKLVVGCVAIAIFHCSALGQDNGSTAILGTVSNELGEPVPNARVDISTAAPISGPAVFCPSCYTDCQKWTTTDEAGRFEITDIDSRFKFRLVVSAAGFRTAQTKLLSPEEKLHELTVRERPRTVDYQRVVQGLVKNEYGVAVQGALISPVRTIDERGLRSSSSKGVSPAVTDATGHFEIDLVDGVFGIDIEIAAEGLCNRRFVDLTPIDDLKQFELFEGGRIVGSVASKGRPANGMTISVAQTDRGYRGEKFFLKANPTVTDTQGQFEFKNLLPDQEYCVYSVVGEADRVNSAAIIKTQKFIAPSSGNTLDIGSLATIQPVSFGGQISRGDEKPSGTLVLLFNRDPAWDLIKVPVANDGSFRIDGLPPEVYEVCLSSNHFELDADKIDYVLWTEKSIKRLIDKSIGGFVLPIRPIERGVPDLEPNGTQKLTGRVMMTGDEEAAKIRVDASDSVEALGKGLGNGDAPWTSTAEDGNFTLAELPNTRVWLKFYRPDEDGETSWYLGMVRPRLNAQDITVSFGPASTWEPGTLSGLVK